MSTVFKRKLSPREALLCDLDWFRGSLKATKEEKSLKEVDGYADELDRKLAEFRRFLTLKCEHCGKKIPLGCTQCAGCADERGP